MPSTSRSWPLTILLGTGVPRARLRSRTTRAGRIEDDRVDRHAVALAERPPGGSALGLQAGRVDHRRQLAPQALVDDQLEQLERVARRALVAFAGPDDGAQAVRRDDLLGREPLRGPLRLARAARTDEHDERWVRKPNHEQRLGSTADETLILHG